MNHHVMQKFNDVKKSKYSVYIAANSKYVLSTQLGLQDYSNYSQSWDNNSLKAVTKSSLIERLTQHDHGPDSILSSRWAAEVAADTIRGQQCSRALVPRWAGHQRFSVSSRRLVVHSAVNRGQYPLKWPSKPRPRL